MKDFERSLLVETTVSIHSRDNKALLGTGILIKPNQVLTCRHVIAWHQRIPADDLLVIFNSRDADPRRVTKYWLTTGDWDYRKDVAVLELEAAFEAGEQILPWSKTFPSQGNRVTFFGYRATARTLLGEIVPTPISQFDPKRGCFMLRDGCTHGFSGGVVVGEFDGEATVVGMVIANKSDQPLRTWALPVTRIDACLEQTRYGLPALTEMNWQVETHNVDSYLKYLAGIRDSLRISNCFLYLESSFISGGPNAPAFSAMDYFTEFIQGISNTSPSKLCILGNYGTGKTSLAVERCYESTQAFKQQEEGRILPIYIPMKFWSDLPSQEEFISFLVGNPRYPFSSQDEFYAMHDLGKIVFVLDGIDEIIKKLDEASSPGLIQRIPTMLPENSSFVILARTSFFISRTTIMDVLALSKNEVPPLVSLLLERDGFQAIHIEPLQSEEINRYIETQCGNDAEIIQELVKDTYDLPDLATRPVLLRMIVDCASDLKKRSITIGADYPFTSAELYLTYVHKWLRDPKQQSQLSVPRRMNLLENLALNLIEKGDLSCFYESLSEFVEFQLKNQNETLDFLYDIANCTFLDLNDNGYEFSHKSFLEFFAASGVFRLVMNKTDIAESPFKDYLSTLAPVPTINEISDFLRDLLTMEYMQNPDTVTKILLDWMQSDRPEDRAHAGHLAGHIGRRADNSELLNALVNAFARESEPWPKRSLAIACGRAGFTGILDKYFEEFLPESPHRKVNLSYHLEYYGGLEQTLVAVISHICSPRHEFLRKVDLFTINQIMSCEDPLDSKDRELSDRIKAVVGSHSTANELENVIQSLGLQEFLSQVIGEGK